MGRFAIRFSILILIACCAVDGTQAIPAYPHPVKITMGDDSFSISLRGDENYKFAVTDDGYTVLSDSLGWFYAYQNEYGEVLKSSYMVSSKDRRDLATHTFLTTVPKNIQPSYLSEHSCIKLEGNHYSPLRSNSPIVGERRVLIILMQFSDIRFKKTQTDFNRLFNEQNYREDGAYGSVYDYYYKVSYGQLQLKSDVLGPYTASRNLAYYGGNSSRTSGDMNPKALFDEAIRFAIQEVSLADYDSDGDGYVDNIHIIFAGYGEEAGASANAIWSHEMTFRAENIGGMLIDRYSCSPELRGNSGMGITRIGPPCHEIGHALGAMDFYDVDYQSGGYYEGTGDWDVMASGSWNDDGARPADFNPYVKAYNYGWVGVQTLEQDTTNVIAPSTGVNNIYRIDTPVNGDFFLLDNRQSEGVNSAEPGKGLLIFHVGPQIEQKALTNTINSTYPQQCYVVCASAKYARPQASASSYGSISSAGCPYPGTTHNTTFSNTSIPGSFCVNGKDAEIVLTDISLLSNGNIALRYGKKNEGDVTPPDNPDDEDGNINGDIIWSDDFEVMSHFHTQNWTIESLNGNGKWTIKTFTEPPSEKEPATLSGSRYMAMESSGSNTIMGSASRFSSRMLSNEIQLSAGDYLLTGYYGGYASQKLSNDTLYIDIQTDKDEEWINVKSLRITKRKEWDVFSVPINTNEDVMIRIAFMGSADENSILFIDNIRLYKPEANLILQVAKNEKKHVDYYRLDGMYIGSDSRITTLRSGIYIVRKSDGSTIKIISK